jgi:LCP family protein required for cell wall assembly
VDCNTARALISSGTIPGAANVALGFHLASCPACRGYRYRHDGSAEQTLAELLAQPLPFIASPADLAVLDALLHVPLSSTAQPHSTRARPVLRYVALGAATLLALGLALPVTRAGLAVYTIRSNLRAVIVTPRPVAAQIRTPTMLPATPTPRPLSRQLGLQARDGWAFEQPTATAVPSPTAVPTPEPGAPVTVLFLGSDLRLDQSGPSRADSVMLARIDPQRQRIALLSLTRDLLVNIPGYGYARVNAANAYGGPELVRQAVGNLFGMPIDYFAYVDFAGFISAVDALGGITIHVEKEIYEPGWGLHFRPGPMSMDGITALRYSRSRMSDSDYERVKRQQEVLLGIAQRVRELQTLENLDRMAALSQSLRGAVLTDIPEDQIVRLAWTLRNYPLENVERYSVDGSMVSTFIIPGDPYAQVIDPAVVAQLRARLLGPE